MEWYSSLDVGEKTQDVLVLALPKHLVMRVSFEANVNLDELICSP